MNSTSSTSHPLLQAPGSRLEHLVRRAAALDRLTRALKQLLSPALAAHCRGIAYDSGCLTVFVDSPAWTARLRFHQRTIKDGLEARCNTAVRRLRVKVAPSAAPPSIASRKTPPLTAGTRALLQATANAIEDPELAASLRRLGRED
jgi:hypothetical protein